MPPFPSLLFDILFPSTMNGPDTPAFFFEHPWKLQNNPAMRFSFQISWNKNTSPYSHFFVVFLRSCHLAPLTTPPLPPGQFCPSTVLAPSFARYHDQVPYHFSIVLAIMRSPSPFSSLHPLGTVMHITPCSIPPAFFCIVLSSPLTPLVFPILLFTIFFFTPMPFPWTFSTVERRRDTGDSKRQGMAWHGMVTLHGIPQ